MKPALAQFESEQKNVPYTHVDTDQRETEEWKKYSKHLPQNASIPYSLLLDGEGQEVGHWVGAMKYPDLVNAISEAIEKHQN